MGTGDLGTVVEHSGDLLSESGDDAGVEEGVKTCEDNTADNNADDDLDTGVDISLGLLVLDSGLSGDGCTVELVLDVVDEILHVIISFLSINDVWFEMW